MQQPMNHPAPSYKQHGGKPMDAYLTKYINKYDRWLEEKKISYSSRVIPIHESLDHTKHIIASRQAEKILEQKHTIALADCTCRTKYKNCDKLVNVCMLLDSSGEKWLQKGKAVKISFERAKEVLKVANQEGLVHMSLFKPDHEVFALCSCCACCCHDLQLVLTHGKEYILTKSDFNAADKPGLCTDCGVCAERCPFNARTLENGNMTYNQTLCRGCGLCVTACPEEVIDMRPV